MSCFYYYISELINIFHHTWYFWTPARTHTHSYSQCIIFPFLELLVFHTRNAPPTFPIFTLAVSRGKLAGVSLASEMLLLLQLLLEIITPEHDFRILHPAT